MPGAVAAQSAGDTAFIRLARKLFRQRSETPEPADDELHLEYDFRAMRGLVRDRYAKRYRGRLRIVRLADDVAGSFADEAAVNDALREYL